ncbi:sodium/proline symporter [Candidatus Bathyarchaeota archaeon]|nr:sodium/proline symporter [Candidatus Bathyarchaeota archaeon]
MSMSYESQVAIILVMYFIGMLLMGIFFSRKIKGISSFYVGERQLSAPVTGFSFAATQMSGSTYMGAVGTTAKLGYSFIPGAIGSVLASYWAFPLIGTKMRRIAGKLNSFTLGDILSARFYSKKAIRVLISIIFTVSYIPLIAAQLKAGGNAFEVLLGISYVKAVLLFGAIVVIYTILGGMLAVAWTDFIQGAIMFFGFLIVGIAALMHFGGFPEIHHAFAQVDPRLVSLRGLLPATWVAGSAVMWGFFQIGGNPSSMVRFLIPRDIKTCKKAMLWSLGLSAFIFAMYGIIAPAGRALFPNPKSFDLILPLMVKALLPAYVAGIILAAMLAAMMSTIDSALLLAGSTIARDFYQNIINPEADEKRQLMIARFVTLVIGVISMLIALNPPTQILWLVTMTFSLFAGAFTAVMIATFWWPRATREGAIVSIIAGYLTTIMWYVIGLKTYNSWSMWPGGLWPPFVAVPVAAVVLYVVSKLTKAPPEDVLETFYT